MRCCSPTSPTPGALPGHSLPFPVSRSSHFQTLCEVPRDGNQGVNTSRARPDTFPPRRGPAGLSPDSSPRSGTPSEGVHIHVGWPRVKPHPLAPLHSTPTVWRPWPPSAQCKILGPFDWGREMKSGCEGEKGLGGACVCGGGRKLQITQKECKVRGGGPAPEGRQRGQGPRPAARPVAPAPGGPGHEAAGR